MDGPELPWWQYQRVRLTLLGYGLVAFTYNMSDEVRIAVLTVLLESSAHTACPQLALFITLTVYHGFSDCVNVENLSLHGKKYVPVLDTLNSTMLMTVMIM
eukprot:scaffold75141_cov37-Prasinocladus_malaysianus.AAC.2